MKRLCRHRQNSPLPHSCPFTGAHCTSGEHSTALPSDPPRQTPIGITLKRCLLEQKQKCRGKPCGRWTRADGSGLPVGMNEDQPPGDRPRLLTQSSLERGSRPPALVFRRRLKAGGGVRGLYSGNKGLFRVCPDQRPLGRGSWRGPARNKAPRALGQGAYTAFSGWSQVGSGDKN